ncbi:glycosyltransferase family 4 protein (plasmid) [Pedobacter sp. BS3]|uniref:glycosyltransferase n=1 Tax=Pedobacter sp. BS3 TaxID=2567937 RepID=UPI0011F04C3F|nr:glycosyltransferase [Pedobacter sp. BS3]TZF86209.1 glycosyltransferase family 4 protein [Pedobacter sp. BS3]
MAKICWITPGHLSTSPRLRKEVLAAQRQGYETTVIATQYMPYLYEDDAAFIRQNPQCRVILLSWGKREFKDQYRKYLSGLLQKLTIVLSKIINSRLLNKIALNRYYYWQLKQANKCKADLYVAHNSGALAVAADAARCISSRFAFDAEDFHDAESHSPDILKCIEHIQRRYLDQAIFITAASPLIAQAYQEKYQLGKIEVILNVFPKNNAELQFKTANKLRLFWFSQYIGRDRGIEECLQALALLNHDNVELHLLGLLHTEEEKYFNTLIKKYHLEEGLVRFHPPISEQELIEFTANFDVGLALETGEPYNREVCLTNKLFVYLQAGLALIASNTLAQRTFLEKWPDCGWLVDLKNHQNLSETIQLLIDHPNKLEQAKQKAYYYGANYLNWEREQEKFIYLIHTCLNPKKSLS